jgi:hypothetical protein
MTGDEFLDLMQAAHRRVHIIGNSHNGIIIGLDLEGRMFTVLNGMILNRVNPLAISNRSSKTEFINPGGDTLWPAPEGSCHGYEYSIGKWRVPPSITSASWEVVEQNEHRVAIRAEIDLINNCQLGIPCEFERHITMRPGIFQLTQHVTEKIRYIGDKTLEDDEFLLAPWSLCQFSSTANSKLIIPTLSEPDIWESF